MQVCTKKELRNNKYKEKALDLGRCFKQNTTLEAKAFGENSKTMACKAWGGPRGLAGISTAATESSWRDEEWKDVSSQEWSKGRSRSPAGWFRHWQHLQICSKWALRVHCWGLGEGHPIHVLSYDWFRAAGVTLDLCMMPATLLHRMSQGIVRDGVNISLKSYSAL